MVDIICIMVSGDLLIKPEMSYQDIVKTATKKRKKVKVNRSRKRNKGISIKGNEKYQIAAADSPMLVNNQ